MARGSWRRPWPAACTIRSSDEPRAASASRRASPTGTTSSAEPCSTRNGPRRELDGHRRGVELGDRADPGRRARREARACGTRRGCGRARGSGPGRAPSRGGPPARRGSRRRGRARRSRRSAPRARPRGSSPTIHVPITSSRDSMRSTAARWSASHPSIEKSPVDVPVPRKLNVSTAQPGVAGEAVGELGIGEARRDRTARPGREAVAQDDARNAGGPGRAGEVRGDLAAVGIERGVHARILTA